MVKKVRAKLYRDKGSGNLAVEFYHGNKKLFRSINDNNLSIKAFMRKTIETYMDWNPAVEVIWLSAENLSINNIGVDEVIILSEVVEDALKNYNPTRRNYGKRYGE